MKREEKNVGPTPMFPRVHVKDTAEKGGPGAPPRNKMNLYEHLSIPSRRLSSALTPLNSQTKSNFASSTSSIQMSNVERNLLFPHHLHQLTPEPRSEKLRTHQSNVVDETVMAVSKLEQANRIADDHDCTIPAVVKTQANVQRSADSESFSSISSAHLAQQPVEQKHNCDILKINILMNGNFRHKDAEQTRHDTSKRDKPESEFHCVEERSKLNKLVSDSKHKDDEVSGASMLESISGLNVAPDDVVGMIGQKHFWTTRKAIVNQQRVFAVQVFELHRLVKVQKLIAESPHLLLEDSAFLGKPSLKCSPVNKHPPKFPPKPLHVITNSKAVSEKPSHKRECSTDNVSEKPSLTCIKNDNHSLKNAPLEANPRPIGITTTTTSTAAATDSKTSDPWCFHQPPGPQWLVPVMSPSEGLVYKPYPGPGLPGYGTFGSISAPSNFANSPYGVRAQAQASNHPHMYFPHYGVTYPNNVDMSTTSEQVNQSGPMPGLNNIMEQQSSCNVANPHKNISVLQQGMSSDESSPSDRENGVEKRGPLPLFPVGPIGSEVASSWSHVTEQPIRTRAIKAVPHSRMSAIESAAQIFRFIQEERRHFN